MRPSHHQKPRREKPEYDQKLIDLRRVARVVAGGRRFSFRATLVIGNRKGDVGVGVAKGVDTAASIEKAFQRAKKNLVHVPITPDGTIPHEVRGKYASAVIVMRPARSGRGLMAGGPIRAVCDLAGIQNVTAKILSRSTNRLNNAMVAVETLKKLKASRVMLATTPAVVAVSATASETK
ncbi:MAG: 30S ribosomal protein S5 [Candidatus Ryanbacteria bacterium RIFCSPHIGHO2_02_FULL_48_12]|uniref:Small ribosomal subunit protein uS5 n=1 Tax=Candidatus Ryanbacteria bacterium RIFCSPHIGHO2_01_FULL_48_27 TaxID=1802115 RepID=A0A1G2G548_9BACT|nr:MAG: 30S ribosomal protein S5 [Candidatus Ryanbacteria bacterium RIFCSPHIGHO2_01_FULL_48_27]OGZ50759.1 MAG: 30S ribosomal protein S5 [Candidatus Ryanbacteria bacterium RIFCSPHIGHO2_02_FULL_48_12]